MKELLEGLPSLVLGRVRRDDLAPQRDGLVTLIEPVRRDARHLDQTLHSGRSVEHVELTPIDRKQRAPILAVPVGVNELRDRSVVRRSKLEDRLKVRDRLVGVGELLRPERRHATLKRDEALVIPERTRGIGAALQNADQVVPTRALFEPRLQSVERLGVIRIDLQHLVVGVDHHDVQAQTVPVDLDHLQVDAHSTRVRGRVVTDDEVQVFLQELKERVPFLRLREQTPERGAGGFVVRLELQDRLPRVDRLFGIFELVLSDLSHPEADVDPRLHRGLDLLARRGYQYFL